MLSMLARYRSSCSSGEVLSDAVRSSAMVPATLPCAHVTGSDADPTLPHALLRPPVPRRLPRPGRRAGDAGRASAPTTASTSPTRSSPAPCGRGTRRPSPLRPERQGDLAGRASATTTSTSPTPPRPASSCATRRSAPMVSTAEHTLALMFAVTKHLPAPHRPRPAGPEGRAGRPCARARRQRARPGRPRPHRHARRGRRQGARHERDRRRPGCSRSRRCRASSWSPLDELLATVGRRVAPRTGAAVDGADDQRRDAGADEARHLLRQLRTRRARRPRRPARGDRPRPPRRRRARRHRPRAVAGRASAARPATTWS